MLGGDTMSTELLAEIPECTSGASTEVGVSPWKTHLRRNWRRGSFEGEPRRRGDFLTFSVKLSVTNSWVSVTTVSEPSRRLAASSWSSLLCPSVSTISCVWPRGSEGAGSEDTVWMMTPSPEQRPSVYGGKIPSKHPVGGRRFSSWEAEHWPTDCAGWCVLMKGRSLSSG